MFDENTTPESIQREILKNLSPAFSTTEGSYTDTMTAGVSLELWKLWEAMRSVSACICITKDSPREIIMGRCADCGITPKAGSKATAQLTVTGTDGVTVPKGKRFLAASGLEYLAMDAVTITGGTAAVNVEAAEVGAKHNQPAGHITIQMESQSGIAGVESGPAGGGADPESPESLVNRYHLYIQKPATSANVYQYEQWALSVEGVGGVRVLPLVEGPGTVGVILADPLLLPVDSDTVTRCKAYLDSQRPADAADLLVSSAVGVSIAVTATVRVAASTTKAAVASTLAARLAEYCRDNVSFKTSELPYAKVGYLLMGIDGVEDYSNLRLNGAQSNVTLAITQVPVVGTVVLS